MSNFEIGLPPFEYKNRIANAFWIYLAQSEAYYLDAAHLTEDEIENGMQMRRARAIDTFPDGFLSIYSRPIPSTSYIKNVDWMPDTNRFHQWIVIGLGQCIKKLFMRCTPIMIPAALTGRAKLIAIIDYYIIYYSYWENTENATDNLRILWQSKTNGDRDFSWLEGENSQGKLKFFFEWINRSHDSHPVLSKCKPTNTFGSIEDLLIYFDSPGFDKEHRELFSSKVRALWNQQQRRANLKDKKACNFVLSTSTIKNIKRLSVKYHLTQTEVIEIIIDSESKYEKYIKERISLHESMKKAINFDCPTL